MRARQLGLRDFAPIFRSDVKTRVCEGVEGVGSGHQGDVHRVAAASIAPIPLKAAGFVTTTSTG